MSAERARDGRKMVPLAEAADVLGVSTVTLKRAGAAGEIPLRRIRSVYLLPAAWLDSMTAWPQPDPAEVA